MENLQIVKGGKHYMKQPFISHEAMGEICSYKMGEMQFRVKVMDIKKTKGRISLLVIPCDGKGMAWVDAHKVSFQVEQYLVKQEA